MFSNFRCESGTDMAERDRVRALSLRALEDVLAQANFGPVTPQWGHRVALAWLAQAKAGQDWQFTNFWTAMQDSHEAAWHDDNARYLRCSMLTGLLDRWYANLGLEPPSCVQRSRWARLYNPDIDSGSGTTQLPCMCNRYQPGDRHRIEDVFSATMQGQFNAGPSTVHPKEPGWVVRVDGGQRIIEQMTWGFPVQLRGKKGQLLKPKPVNNARFDKLTGFWNRWAFAPENRCLIPATRFAEAVGTTGAMTETWLSVKDQEIFAWAGLWRESDEWGNCYTGVMTDNAPELAHIHDRSPVILEPDQWEDWLTAPLDDLARFDRPFPADRMTIEATDELWVKR